MRDESIHRWNPIPEVVARVIAVITHTLDGRTAPRTPVGEVGADWVHYWQRKAPIDRILLEAEPGCKPFGGR